MSRPNEPMISVSEPVPEAHKALRELVEFAVHAHGAHTVGKTAAFNGVGKINKHIA